jgi:ribose 5-phosphate isomerase B
MFEKRDNICIASDHAGYNFKERLKRDLSHEGIKVKDYGTDSEESTDYPDYVHPLARAIENGEYKLGIVLCGSGNGVNITANKHKGIRSELCWKKELAALARKHNNANVLALPARFIEYKEALEITKTFLKYQFDGGRHERRVEKISKL